MKYDKSEIMKRAHAIYKEGSFTFSISLSRAWTEAKIELIEARRFEIALVDLPSRNQREIDCQLSAELSTLRRKLNPIEVVCFIPLTEAEKAEVEKKMFSVLNDFDDVDWDAYAELEVLRNKGRAA